MKKVSVSHHPRGCHTTHEVDGRIFFPQSRPQRTLCWKYSLFVFVYVCICVRKAFMSVVVFWCVFVFWFMFVPVHLFAFEDCVDPPPFFFQLQNPFFPFFFGVREIGSGRSLFSMLPICPTPARPRRLNMNPEPTWRRWRIVSSTFPRVAPYCRVNGRAYSHCRALCQPTVPDLHARCPQCHAAMSRCVVSTRVWAHHGP